MEKNIRVVRDICGKRISLPTDLLTYSNFQVFKNSYYPLCEQPSEGVLKKGISLLDLHNYFFLLGIILSYIPFHNGLQKAQKRLFV